MWGVLSLIVYIIVPKSAILTVMSIFRPILLRDKGAWLVVLICAYLLPREASKSLIESISKDLSIRFTSSPSDRAIGGIYALGLSYVFEL